MKTYIYLASPYTAHRDDGSYDDVLMQERYEAVVRCFQGLLGSGLTVFCPIAMTHAADCLYRNLHGNRMSPKFWYEFDKPFLQNASQLFVLKLPGWEESEGLEKEIAIALDRKLPIVYLEHHSAYATRLET